MSYVGKKNAYTCEACHYVYVTVDRDEGVTPFMLRCRRPAGKCGAFMRSHFYQVDQGLTPLGEWYRPEESEVRRLSPAEKDHVRQGGLLLRGIGA